MTTSPLRFHPFRTDALPLVLLALALLLSDDSAGTAVAAAAAATTVRWSQMELLMSETKPGNVLPQYLFLQGAEEGGKGGVNIGGGRGTPLPFEPDDSCDDDIFDGANPDLRSPQLPYLSQDDWGCERENKSVEVLVMENDFLRASIVPQWGGKIWSLYDKVNKRDMLYNNAAHQPANIGALKAWTAGGCEFNWSPGIIGHSAFTEAPVYAAKIESELGTSVRVYEFDRYNKTFWQVDIVLDNDKLWIHPKVTNPTDDDLRGYWWTCVAHKITPESRVITPAKTTVQTSSPGGSVSKSSWPYFSTFIQDSYFDGVSGHLQPDNSMYGDIPGHIDIFVRIYKPQTPYIGHAYPDGYTIVHAHEINGTKFFTWGKNPMANFWMDFLAGGVPGGGDYAELQVGPAPTQMQTFSLAKNSTKEWTEVFTAFYGNKTALFSKEYSAATEQVNQKLPSDEETETMREKLVKIANIPVTIDNIVHNGSSWGALNAMLESPPPPLSSNPTSNAFSVSELMFVINEDDAEEVKPWLELLQEGTFSNLTLADSPVSYMTRPEWAQRINSSATKYGKTWLHLLHLGIHTAERGDSSAAFELFEASIVEKPSAQAYRSLAVLSTNPEDAYGFYMKAWDLAIEASFPSASRLRLNLAAEICRFMDGLAMMDADLATCSAKYAENVWLQRISSFLEVSLPKVPDASTISSNDDVLLASLRKAIYVDEAYDKAIGAISSSCFPTFGSRRASVIDLWHAAHILKFEREDSTCLSPLERHKLRTKYQVPSNIGCPYPDNSCTTYHRPS